MLVDRDTLRPNFDETAGETADRRDACCALDIVITLSRTADGSLLTRAE
jgi:hypothetical protein